jgi:hypothetical protein
MAHIIFWNHEMKRKGGELTQCSKRKVVVGFAGQVKLVGGQQKGDVAGPR